MDLWSLQIKITTNRSIFSPQISSFSQRNSWTEKPSSCNFGRLRPSRPGENRCRSLMIVRATGKKKNHDNSASGSSDQPTPEGDGSNGRNPVPDRKKSDDTTTNKLHHKISDWRDFRAHLVAGEQAQQVDTDAPVAKLPQKSSKLLGPKWAHPIPVPETGCVLVATEKLDGVPSFERSVVLLLRSGTRNTQEGPFGVVLNRPLRKKIKHMKPTNLDLATTFADCSLHFGGPLEASMFLVKTGENLQLPGFEQVIPGLCFGSRNSLDDAAGLVKKGVLRTQDMSFFVGYSGWQLDQLKEEIESDYWFVSACSTNLISAALLNPTSDLWEEILQLMGGQYSELSRKPKQDG